MASASIITKKEPYANGEVGVFLLVIHNRKQAKKQLFRVLPKHWNGEKVLAIHPHSAVMNKTLRQTLYDVQNKIYELDSSGVSYTAHDLLDHRGKQSRIVDCIDDYSKNKPHSGQRKYDNLRDHIDNFRKDATMADINIEWLENFWDYLIGLKTINSTTTVSRYLVSLKTILLNQAKKGNYSDQRVLNYDIPKGEVVQKPHLSKEEVAKIAECDICELARDIFLACLYLNGTRIRDVLLLRPENIVDGRINITEQKTGKYKSIRIIDEVQVIIDRYKGKSEWYVFPILSKPPSDPKVDKKFYKHIESKTAIVNRDLKLIAKYTKINKKLTTHVARHTFSYWSDKANVAPRVIQSMLNHSDFRTTQKYIGELRRFDEQDEAQDKVFG